MATLQTYRDRLTWKIVAYDPNTWTEKYLWPDEYKQKVSSWIVSGSPLDYSLLAQAKTQQPSKAIAWSTPSWLEWFNKLQALKEAANRIILMKQNQNKDLTEAGQYWRNIASNPSSFWTKDQSVPASMQTDESYRLLSPEQQSSIRSARENWARAWLGAVEDERKYREKLSWTALDNVREMYKSQIDKEESDRNYWLQASQEARAIAQAKYNMWLDLSESDYKSLWITATWNRTGGSLSWRNNNPWNLKYRPWMDEFGWSKDANSAFASFPDEESAYSAYKALLTSPTWIYAWLSPNQAMLKWSSDYAWDPKAYNYDKLVSLWAPAVSKPFSKFTDKEWTQFFEAQKKAEWWKEWETLSATKNTYTDTQLRNLSKKTWVDLADLKKRSDQELISLESSLTTDTSWASQFAKTAEWVRIQAMHWLSADELSAAIQIFSNSALTQDQKKEILLQSWLPEWLYTSLLNAFNK